MKLRFCKKCNKMCHCANAEKNECPNCECNSRAEDVLENEGGLIIDDTGDCESCQQDEKWIIILLEY